MPDLTEWKLEELRKLGDELVKETEYSRGTHFFDSGPLTRMRARTAARERVGFQILSILNTSEKS